MRSRLAARAMSSDSQTEWGFYLAAGGSMRLWACAIHTPQLRWIWDLGGAMQQAAVLKVAFSVNTMMNTPYNMRDCLLIMCLVNA